MKRIALWLSMLLIPFPALAQNGAVTGYCVKGATPAITSGLNSSNTLQGVVPGGPAGCLVQVYLTGTTTPATIYSNVGGTLLSNPFRASLSGQWLFYAATSSSYDVVLSGGIAPNTYQSPVTLTGMTASSTSSGGITQLTGDVTTPSGSGSQVATLATVNSASGSCGDATHICQVTTNPKGLTTTQAAVAIGGVNSLNTLTGALTIACSAGLTCTPSGGNTITISLATAFSITSFTGGSTVEVGASVINPTFAATYSVTPVSANITNTDSISSPTNLTTPFTSGTITGTFVHTSPTTTTFTLSATQGSTLTATQAISWQPAIFGGVGTAGATSTVTASGTTAVLSNGNILSRIQLGAEVAGSTCPPATCFTSNPSNQVIYLLLTGGSHTFTDNSTGFPVPMNAPITVSFLNANGVTVTMYLYSTQYAVYGSSTIRVAS